MQQAIPLLSRKKYDRSANNEVLCHLWFQVFELSPSLYVVELKKSHGDPALYRQVKTAALVTAMASQLTKHQQFERLSDLASWNVSAALWEDLQWPRCAQDGPDLRDYCDCRWSWKLRQTICDAFGCIVTKAVPCHNVAWDLVKRKQFSCNAARNGWLYCK